MAPMRKAALAVLVALLATPASAADILDACSGDIQTHCAKVTPGHGRVASCLYAHEDQVSDACDAALADTGDALDSFFHTLWEMKTACGDDIRAQCQEVAIGGGRILSCLNEHRSAISPECSQMVDEIALPASD